MELAHCRVSLEAHIKFVRLSPSRIPKNYDENHPNLEVFKDDSKIEDVENVDLPLDVSAATQDASSFVNDGLVSVCITSCEHCQRSKKR